MEPILRVRGLAKRFGPVEVLRGIDLALAAGEVLAVLGENGAGKSTLVRILSGVHTDYDGEILLSGRAVRFAGTRDAERAGIAIIHQELNLVPELTVAENIFLGREPLRAGLFIDRGTMRREARILMRRLGLTVNPGARIASLRIGEQQLVEIAKALSLEARVLIMDEPTSALSPAECDLLFGVVRELRRQGVAVVYISHRMDEIFQLADRVMVLRDGRHVRTAPIGELSRKELIQLMVGRELAEHGLDPAPPREGVILSVRQLGLAVARRDGGWRQAVEHVSFDLHRGEILGIAGLLGAGRTEILETLFGAARGRR
ncbi:MAG: sugar ABC transporter ATP-binding protein, partial [Geminicoccaceae bacterium]